MIQTKALVSAEIGFHFDIDPKAITSPRGREIASVTRNIFSVSPKPTRRSSVILKN